MVANIVARVARSMGPCSVSTRSQSKPTDAISSATSGSPKFRRLPKHAFPARNRCFTWLGVIGRQYSAGENLRGGAGGPPPPPPPPHFRGDTPRPTTAETHSRQPSPLPPRG